MPRDPRNTLQLGPPLAEAHSAVVLIHGRGSSAEDIAALARVLRSDGVSFFAPAADRGTWYPERFFAPIERNEPWLSEALSQIKAVVDGIEAGGVPTERIGLVGFSQGGCLALEFAFRRSRRHGFVAGLSGALVGPLDLPRAFGDLHGTPVLLGCAEHDPHIPLAFVEASATTLAACSAAVTKRIFPGNAHTIFREEIDWIRQQQQELGQ